MQNPWDLYDNLIEDISDELRVDYFTQGLYWTLVRSGSTTGVAMTVKQTGPKMLENRDVTGMKLKEVARLSKSWDFTEASIGVAALNAYYNSKEKVENLGGFVGFDINNLSYEERIEKNAFINSYDEIKDKNIAVIGHFPDLEIKLKDHCNLSILERNPSKGDYPDPACEYILRDQDYVFITGMALTNKTLPRLLELSRKKAKISIVGPSIPIAKVLSDYGVSNISGFCVLDSEMLDLIIRSGGRRSIFKSGIMISRSFNDKIY